MSTYICPEQQHQDYTPNDRIRAPGTWITLMGYTGIWGVGGCIGARHPVLQNCDSHTTMTRALSKTSRGYDFRIQDTTIYRLNLK